MLGNYCRATFRILQTVENTKNIKKSAMTKKKGLVLLLIFVGALILEACAMKTSCGMTKRKARKAYKEWKAKR